MTVHGTSGADSLKKRLVEGLAAKLDGKDYIYTPQWEQFRKLTPGGFQSLILSVSEYPDASLFELHLGIRLDAVENMAYPFTNGLMGFQANSLTLVTPLAKLHGHSFQRFELAPGEEVGRPLDEIAGQLAHGGFSFLEKYNRLEEMEQLFNRHPHHPLPLVHNQINRCLRGLVLARLTDRTDFERLATLYRDRLRALRAPDATLHKYDRLRSYLRSYAPN